MAPTLDWVIDCDTHVTEPAHTFVDRVPRKLRDRAPRLVRNDDGVDIWHVGEATPVVPVGMTAIAGWKDPFPAAPKNMDEVPAASWDAKARLQYMDSQGIWAMALYPNVGGFGNQAFLKLGDPELMLACVRAYNDFLIEWIEPDPRRFIPVLATPFWDVEATVKEIERAAALGHKAILFSGEPQNLGMPPLGSPHWDPLWAAAQDTGLPISFHIGSADFTEGLTPERIEADGFQGTYARVAVELFLENGRQLVDLLLCGVLPRFPKLKVVSVESGIGFIPFLLEAVDHTFDYAGVRTHKPYFKELPSEYFKRQVYGCYFFEEYAPQRMVEKIGADNILFETDYPHPVCLYGNVREKIDTGLRDQPDPIRRKLLFDNAAKLYGVEAPDVPVPTVS